VVAWIARRVRRQRGDHKGRAYTVLRALTCDT